MDYLAVGSDVNTLAIQTRDVQKFYGTGRNAFHVLRGLNMSVPRGTIYGLLGASGCGKTTLLRCILGRLPIHSGHIIILGKPPGAPGHTVPGKDVGYMPQETALIYEFTMLELMYYFGILYRMNLKYIRKRTEFLKNFLNLPTIHCRCKILSGGQKRRVSFALALLQEPPLLILDEPTVGIDPLLKAKIWHHLLEITAAGNTTIVITTHYIEEARQANVVGLMRSGRLLAEAKPNDLIRDFNVTTLEDVLLKFSEEDETAGQTKARASIKSFTTVEPTELTSLVQSTDDDDVKPPPLFTFPRCSFPSPPKVFNLAALVWKQFMRFIREPLLLFFVLFSSLTQLSVFCLSYGGDIKDIKVYLTNLDTNEPTLFPRPLGELFINHIDRDTIDLKFTSDPQEGMKKVEDGKAVAYVLIPVNYTDNYFQRTVDVCVKMLKLSPVDITDQEIYSTVNLTLTKAHESVMKIVGRSLSIPEYISHPLFNISKYVYGKESLKYSDTVFAGAVGAMFITLSITLTASQLITERKEGVIDRTWVAGVSAMEIVFAQIIVFFILLIFQMTPSFFTIHYGFDVPKEGSMVLVFVIFLIEGMVGFAFGLAISAYVNSESFALELAIALVYPVLLSAGLLWPLQSLPDWVRYTCYSFPMAVPTDAVRSILLRGWGLDHLSVWMGLIIPFSWFLVFVVLTVIGLHLKK
ncbi:ABC transporter G family member 20-like isoform X2 [Dysidea avara]|uniref:ABC transporter G family member 20-like isoform X2 n=1 Tax=Dysidea avara TaxID=196820 RepID=UPI00332FA0D3